MQEELGKIDAGMKAETARKAENVREDVTRTGRVLRDRAAIIKDDVAELASSATDIARQQMDPVLQYIRENPFRAVLISAGVGLVLGTMMRRR
jgi:ElaB/YqjD/DUF883 family membrane-anchored ribosome-binding protein